MKSETAANAVKAMNPDVNIHAHQNRVGPDTEGILSFKNQNLFEAGNRKQLISVNTVITIIFVDVNMLPFLHTSHFYGLEVIF